MAGMSNNDALAPVVGSQPVCFNEASRIARFLEAENAEDVWMIDISVRSGFADYFLIGTAASFGQLRGLVRNLDEQLAALGIHVKGTKRTVTEDDNWVLIDCGDFIVHLMTKPAREFYALERLWFDCPRVNPADGSVIPRA